MGPAGDPVGAGRGARGLQGSGTGDGGLKKKMRSPRQNPAPSIPLPKTTSRTAGPPGAFLRGAWLTPPLTGYLKDSNAGVRGSQKKRPSHRQVTNSIAGRNRRRLLVNVESRRSLQTSAARARLRSSEGGRPPAGRLLAGSLNQNPICLYFLFSAGSPRGCSFDDQVEWLCAYTCA